MHKSKLIDLITVFDRKEKEALKKWVQSPVHNQHQKSTELILILLSKRSLTARTANRYHIYQQLFPKQEYDDAALKYLMSYAVKILEDFIEYLMQKRDAFLSKKNLIKFLTNRKLDKYAQQWIKRLEKQQSTELIQNNDYYYRQYQLERVIFEYQNVASRGKENNLQDVLENHYLVFVLRTLRYACEVITHQRLYKSSYEVPLLDAVLLEVKAGKYQDIPAIQLYFNSYMALSSPEEEQYFKTLQQLLAEHHAVLPPKELKSIYLIAINYCVRRLNSGDEAYVQAVFELFQYGLQYAILVEDGKLSQFTYKNSVTAALRLNEFKWTAQFIKEYTPLLELAYQTNYELFAKSKLLFAQKDYDACLALLAQVDFDDVFLNMNAKSMLLKIYYECANFEALDALIVSFRRFLQRKTIVAYQRKIYENMIVLTEQLMTIPTYDKEKKQALYQTINDTHPLTEKPWLLAQLAKL